MYNIANGWIRNDKIAVIIDENDRAKELINIIVPTAIKECIYDFILKKSSGY